MDSFKLYQMSRQSVANVQVASICTSAMLPRRGKSSQVTLMRRITTFRSTTDRIHDGGPIRL